MKKVLIAVFGLLLLCFSATAFSAPCSFNPQDTQVISSKVLIDTTQNDAQWGTCTSEDNDYGSTFAITNRGSGNSAGTFSIVPNDGWILGKEFSLSMHNSGALFEPYKVVLNNRYNAPICLYTNNQQNFCVNGNGAVDFQKFSPNNYGGTKGYLNLATLAGTACNTVCTNHGLNCKKAYTFTGITKPCTNKLSDLQCLCG